MAFVDVAAAVGTAVGADALGATAATVIGGGLLGVGAGGLYGALTGGNIGQDMLYGGALGAGGAYLGGAGAVATDATPGAIGAGPAATAYTPSIANSLAANSVGAGLTPTLGSIEGGAGLGQSLTPTLTSIEGGSAYGAPISTDYVTNALSNTNPLNTLSTEQQLNPDAWGSEVGTNPADAAAPQNFVPGSTTTPSASPGETSGLLSGLSKGQKYMLGGLGVLGASNLLGLNKPTTFTTPNQPAPMNTGYYKLDPSTFQPGRPPQTVNPVKPGVTPPYPNYLQNPYQPTGYASGGIAGYKDSNYQDLKDKQAEYQYFANMVSPQQSSSQDPSWVKDIGIVTDVDPNTKNLSPLEAAKYQRAKLMAAAGMPTSAGIGLNQQTSPYATINTDPLSVQQQQAQQAQQTQNAASGGIMGYSLGGYASGGNPRLLHGPGDGMSDDIPAVIGQRQPARLADGEFVVPADVVSHLGNGSTKAGAEKLHGMMDKIRVAKTGKKKQAPQLKTDKFIPKV